ncbi:MAG: ABC transporter substrate-binding protein [Anaerolineales bacterium]
MRKRRVNVRAGRVSFLVLILLASCAQPVELELPVAETPATDEAPPTEIPTPLPVPKTLIVCLGQEPESLYRYSNAYLYGSTSRAAETVLQALYDGPLNVRSYEYEPVILSKLPSIADGDARLEQASVLEDDLYFDPATLQPSVLQSGDRYLPSGCNSPDCMRTFSGGEVTMDQIVAEFQIRPDVNWSDGEPVTATDSVFSFAVDRNIETPTLKTQADRTASYEAINDKTTRWTGIPGYIDSEYYSNFWSPLPEHQLGEMPPEDLLTAEGTNFNPLGWGPYVMAEWRSGNDIRMTRNPTYFRSSEGLPAFDTLLFRFLGGDPPASIEQLLTSECDILDEGAIADALDIQVLDPEALVELQRLSNSGRIGIANTAGAEMERLDFGLMPAAQSGLLAERQLRTALVSCLDRASMAQAVLRGLTEVPETYLPPSHPLYAEQVPGIEFDPQMATELLDELGWVDHDEDPGTARVAKGVTGVQEDTELSFQYLTTPDGLHQAVAAWIQNDLLNCGIALNTEYLPQSELFEPWPKGPAFGRNFQTIGWAWPAWVSPLCEMFHSDELPSADTPFGVNATGFSDPDYDAACGILLHSLPESPEYVQAAQGTQQILAESLATVPLYMRPRLLAHGANICGVQVDATEYSAIWNLEEIHICSAAP